MGYGWQLKTFEQKDGVKYKVIEVTDITLHTGLFRATPAGREVKESFEGKRPGRIYMPNSNPDDTKSTLLDMLRNDPDFVKMAERGRKKRL